MRGAKYLETSVKNRRSKSGDGTDTFIARYTQTVNYITNCVYHTLFIACGGSTTQTAIRTIP